MSERLATARPTPDSDARTRDPAGTRARILDATIALLVDTGFAKTSTWAVCERARLSRGALLHHFPTRIDLLIAAIDHLAKAPLSELDAALADAPPREQVRIFLEWLWGTLDGDLFAVGLELLTAARTEPELKRAIREGGDVLQARLEFTVRAIVASNGQADGGPLASALCLSIPAVRGIGLDLTVGGDRNAHRRRFSDWCAHLESLAA